ncbi:MAG: Ribosomal RNA small subunit methyltransferase B [Holosporales bacterium]
MKPIARLSAIHELLEEIHLKDNRKPADDLFVQYCRQRRYIGSKDRQFLSRFFFDLLRYYQGLNNAFVVCDVPHSHRLMIYVYWYTLFVSYDGLEEERYGMDLPTELEKKQIQKLATAFRKQKIVIPDWMTDLFGDDSKALIDSLHQEATFDIRINPLLTNREFVLKELKTIGYKAHPTKFSPYGIRLEQRVPLQATKLWEEGLIEIQDEGAQLVSLLCDARSGETILDYCAGAGGKTLLMAACMKNRGRIIATDKYLYRLEQGKKRYRRADVHNIQIKDLSDTKWWKRHTKTFDRVLIDVPCSGSGTWRRNPDLKMRFTQKDLDELLVVQQNILEASQVYVKKGGELIYATCSVWEKENIEQIQLFLKKHPEFRLIDLRHRVRDLNIDQESLTTSSMIQLTPHQHGVDGFFMAALLKTE